MYFLSIFLQAKTALHCICLDAMHPTNAHFLDAMHCTAPHCFQCTPMQSSFKDTSLNTHKQSALHYFFAHNNAVQAVVDNNAHNSALHRKQTRTAS